ncbi:hypothetical protein [Streptomyces sp. 2A115]|uniref:hypothetical protein n=1 Tax=Streptomyces sp. 2A115 TaxID=3457439 RepID=UPI003FD625E0
MRNLLQPGRGAISGDVYLPPEPGEVSWEALAAPYADTGAEHLLLGLDEDLDEAVRKATRSALTLLSTRYGLPAPIALAYLSAAHPHVSQVVDTVKGVHFAVPKPTLESL